MRSNSFPDGVGCTEENHGMTWLPWPTELQEMQGRSLGPAPFFPRAQEQVQEGRETQGWGEVSEKPRD